MYNCIFCNYNTKIKSHFEQHLKSKRHIINSKFVDNIVGGYYCKNCGRSYSCMKTLNYHQKEKTCCILTPYQKNQGDNLQINTENNIQNVEIISQSNNNNNNTNIETQNNYIDNSVKVVNINLKIGNGGIDISGLRGEKLRLILEEKLNDLLSIEEFSEMIELTYKEMNKICFAYDNYARKEKGTIKSYLLDLANIYNDILMISYNKFVKTEPNILPIICNDTKARNYHMKREKWDYFNKEDNVTALLKIINNQIMSKFNGKTIFLEGSDYRFIATHIIKNHNSVNFNLESYKPAPEIRKDYKCIKDEPKEEFTQDTKIDNLCKQMGLVKFDITRHRFYTDDPELMGGDNDLYGNSYYLYFDNDHYRVRESSLECHTVDGSHFVGYYIHELHTMIHNYREVCPTGHDKAFVHRISDELKKIYEENNDEISELDKHHKIQEIIEKNQEVTVRHNKNYYGQDQRIQIELPYIIWTGDFIRKPIKDDTGTTFLLLRNTNYLYHKSKFYGLQSDDNKIVLKDELIQDYNMLYTHAQHSYAVS
jgi:hypothetical protein